MKLEKRKPSGREKNQVSINLLEQLRQKLYSDDVSTRRRAAFNLSWIQEDGLDILKEVLLSNSQKTTKNAAAYGLRSMRGRMKKAAKDVLRQGLKHPNSNTREVCKNALLAIGAKTVEDSPPKRKKGQVGRFKIKEIPTKSRQKRKIHKKQKKNTNLHRPLKP